MDRSRSAATSKGSLPEAIAGVDMVLGLELLTGNRLLYLSLLRKFLAGHKDTTAAIRRALAADDWEIAKLIAHNTKGVSGCIGATALQQRAAELEGAIRAQSFDLDALLHRFDEALGEVVAALEQALPPEQPPLDVIA
jgi:two-component system, sensor histidine kinase and response regulator